MVHQFYAVEFVGKLFGIDVMSEMSFSNRSPRRIYNYIEPVPLKLHEFVANWTGKVIKLRCGVNEQAPTLQRAGFRPLTPVFKERAQPGLASGLGEGGTDHGIDKFLDARFQSTNLQGFFRLKMGVESALGEIEILGKAPDRQSAEPDFAGKSDRMVENLLPGYLSLAHFSTKIARPFPPNNKFGAAYLG